MKKQTSTFESANALSYLTVNSLDELYQGNVNYMNHLKNYQPRNQFEQKERVGRILINQLKEATTISGTCINDKTRSDVTLSLQQSNFPLGHTEIKVKRYHSVQADGTVFEPFLDRDKIEFMKQGTEDHYKRTGQYLPAYAAFIFLHDGQVKIYSLAEEFKFEKRKCRSTNESGKEVWRLLDVTYFPDCLLLHQEKIEITEDQIDIMYQGEKGKYTKESVRAEFKRKQKEFHLIQTYQPQELPAEYFNQIIHPPYL